MICGITSFEMVQGDTNYLELEAGDLILAQTIGSIYFTCGALNLCKQFFKSADTRWCVKFEINETKDIEIIENFAQYSFDVTVNFLNGNKDSSTGNTFKIYKKQNPVTREVQNE